ncbi:MAG: carbon-nitrogen hydrolase family protein [Anaerolineae bacterium]
MADTRTLRVAAAQVHIGAGMVENLATILAAMDRCAVAGAELAVFPETALTGYSPAIGHGREPGEWPDILAALDTIAARAKARGLWTVVGSDALTDAGWMNRLYAFSAQGEPVATYDKVHLMVADTRFYAAGHAHTFFDLNGIRVGLQICYDARFPEGYRALLAQGVEVVVQGFYGAARDTWKVPVLGAHLRSRAAENGCFVVAANVSGPLQIVVSQIIDPLGLLLAQANQDVEELVLADLDLARVADSEIRQDLMTRFTDYPHL